MGPIIFISLGASGLAITIGSVLTPYRPIFAITSVAFLGYSYYNYEKKGVKNKRTEILLTVVTIMVVAFMIIPVLYPYFAR